MRIEDPRRALARRSSARIGSWPTRRPSKAATRRSSSGRRRRGPRGRSRRSASVPRGPRRLPTSGRLPRSGLPPSPINSPGKKDGYRPQFNFGPPGGAPPKPMDDQTIGEVVKAPPGFRVTLFAAPPKVGYPVTLAVAPGGEVFVAVDEQGSLGRTPGGGRVLRCLDDDGDGKAERVNVFAKDGAPARPDRPGRESLGPASAVPQRLPRSGRRRRLRSPGSPRLGPDDQLDRRARRRPHDQRHPHGDRRLDLHRRRRLRIPRGEREGRHDAVPARRRDPPRPARRHGAGGLRHRPPQSVRHRDRPVPEPLYPGQHQRRGGLGRARQPPDPDRRLRLLAAVRQLPGRDHADPWAPMARGAARVRCSSRTSAGPSPIAARSLPATGAGAKSTGTT